VNRVLTNESAAFPEFSPAKAPCSAAPHASAKKRRSSASGGVPYLFLPPLFTRLMTRALRADAWGPARPPPLWTNGQVENDLFKTGLTGSIIGTVRPNFMSLQRHPSSGAWTLRSPPLKSYYPFPVNSPVFRQDAWPGFFADKTVPNVHSPVLSPQILAARLYGVFAVLPPQRRSLASGLGGQLPGDENLGETFMAVKKTRLEGWAFVKKYADPCPKMANFGRRTPPAFQRSRARGDLWWPKGTGGRVAARSVNANPAPAWTRFFEQEDWGDFHHGESGELTNHLIDISPGP